MSETATPESPHLTETQQKIRLRLMQGETLDRIATMTQLTVEEVCQVIADPLFLTSINAVREAQWQHLICQVLALAVKAVETLAGTMQDKDPSIRARASRLLLDYQLKLQKAQSIPQKRHNSEESVRKTTNKVPRGGAIAMPGVR